MSKRNRPTSRAADRRNSVRSCWLADRSGSRSKRQGERNGKVSPRQQTRRPVRISLTSGIHSSLDRQRPGVRVISEAAWLSKRAGPRCRLTVRRSALRIGASGACHFVSRASATAEIPVASAGNELENRIFGGTWRLSGRILDSRPMWHIGCLRMRTAIGSSGFSTKGTQ